MGAEGADAAAAAADGGGAGLAMVLIVGAVTVAMYMPQMHRIVPQERLDDQLRKASNFMDEQRDRIALACLLALGLLHISLGGGVRIEDERGLALVYRRLMEWWPLRRYAGVFFGLYARQVSRTARGIFEKAAARASFERYGFNDRVNISLNSLDRVSGALQLRTLDELDLEKVLPDAGARQLYKHALQWTDLEEEPAEFDPFVSLSSSGRVGPIPEASPAGRDDLYEKGRRARQYHSMIVDQLKNVISAPYAVGHIGKDMRLQYMTREYVWGVTMEKRGANGNEVPDSSLKTRILLIQKEFLEHIDDHEPDDSADDNVRDRWLRLQKLRELWEAEGHLSNDDARCFLVGSTKITVAKPGGDLATSPVRWDDYLEPISDIHERTSTRAHEGRLQRSSTKSPGDDGGATTELSRQRSRQASRQLKKRVLWAYRELTRLFKEHPLPMVFVVMVMLVWLDLIDLLDTVWAISTSRFGQVTFGAFARDILFQVCAYLRRVKDQRAFGERGFANRLNISLNSFILEDNRPSTASEGVASAGFVSMELRTLAEMSIHEVLPSAGAQQKLHDALRWTERNQAGAEATKRGIHPFVSLSEQLGQLGKDQELDHGGASEKERLREFWRMSCSQVDNQISAPFATGHIGADMRQNYRCASQPF